MIDRGDCSGPASAGLVLGDTSVEFAVLECARGGILRAGLGFDHCSTSIVTNISDDHLGLDGIITPQQMAEVKAVVARSTLSNGTAVLNADDDLVYNMREDLSCNISLYSLSSDNPRLESHCRSGGLAATIHHGFFVLKRGNLQSKLVRVNEVPMTLDGRLGPMIANALAAILAAVSEGIPLPVIRDALVRFTLSPEKVPGRMNRFAFNHFEVVLDYAHNPGGFEMLKKFAASSSATFRTGVIAAAGERRDEDIRHMGSIAGSMFTQIIIRHDDDTRGRKNEEITALLMEGIRSVNSSLPCSVISDELKAVEFAIRNAFEGSLIVICGDKLHECIQLIHNLQSSQHLLQTVALEQNY